MLFINVSYLEISKPWIHHNLSTIRIKVEWHSSMVIQKISHLVLSKINREKQVLPNSNSSSYLFWNKMNHILQSTDFINKALRTPVVSMFRQINLVQKWFHMSLSGHVSIFRIESWDEMILGMHYILIFLSSKSTWSDSEESYKLAVFLVD